MKSTEKSDNVLPPSVIPCDLHGAFDRLRAGIAEVKFVRTGHGRNVREAFRQLDHALVIEIRTRHMNQFRRLILDGLYHLRMTMAGRANSDARSEIEKFVAIDVFHPNATSSFGDHRIGTRITWRNPFMIALDNSFRLESWQ